MPDWQPLGEGGEGEGEEAWTLCSFSKRREKGRGKKEGRTRARDLFCLKKRGEGKGKKGKEKGTYF